MIEAYSSGIDFVMPGLVPGIHVLTSAEAVDGRNKSGHDDGQSDCMHDIRFIRENPDAFDRALARRNLS